MEVVIIYDWVDVDVMFVWVVDVIGYAYKVIVNVYVVKSRMDIDFQISINLDDEVFLIKVNSDLYI